MLDLLIRNASVLDGTGSDAFVASIGVKDGKIVSVGDDIAKALQVIDATGLTVTPGFIDSHSHSDRAMRNYPEQREKIEQGITLSIAGQCGSSVAPARDKDTGEITTMGDFLREIVQVPQGSSAKC